MTFLLAEMGTSGSLDGQQRLVIKGRFAPKNFEGILRRYVSKFLLSFPDLYMQAAAIWRWHSFCFYIFVNSALYALLHPTI